MNSLHADRNYDLEALKYTIKTLPTDVHPLMVRAEAKEPRAALGAKGEEKKEDLRRREVNEKADEDEKGQEKGKDEGARDEDQKEGGAEEKKDEERKAEELEDEKQLDPWLRLRDEIQKHSEMHVKADESIELIESTTDSRTR